MEHKGYIVISLGGSLIAPNQIDTDYLKKFIDMIKVYINGGYRFAIITGGGKFARYYQDALKIINNPDVESLDWIGIHTTRLNAELLKTSFGDLSCNQVIIDPTKMENIDSKIIIGAGWKPGRSTDYCAVLIAEKLGARRVVNLSNIDYVYDKDPKKNPDAKPILKSNWYDFRALLPTEWDPGLNAPFDPIAAKKAEELNLEVAILNGQNIENLKNYLDNREFVGTVIK